MCIIIWSPSGMIPKDQVFRAMQKHPNGWGFTVHKKEGINLTYKSADFKRFLWAWSNRPIGPVLFHARWATHGEVNDANCHPFVVRSSGLVVAHNGIIPGYGTKAKSDTRDFVDKVIRKLPKWFTEEKEILDALTKAIGDSKMVFLRDNGEVTILREKAGVWKDGMWYSNCSAF